MYLLKSQLARLLLLVLINPMLVLSAAAADNKSDVAPAGLNHHLKPALGQAATINQTIVSPDGSGLPGGRGTVFEGKLLYDTKCASCHGIDGKQPGNQLAGGIGSITTERPLKTVGSYWPYATTLYDYIARAMPYNEQKSLSANEVYAITAYVLRLNGILDDDAFLDRENLPKLAMPNREGFVELY